MPATARRDFIFIDEHGDPGPAATGSTHFASIAVHTTDTSLAPLVECSADLRFYRQIYRETKSLDSIPALRPKLAEILRHMAAAHGIAFSITQLDKRRFTGPYMDPVDGVRFRNFQVRCRSSGISPGTRFSPLNARSSSTGTVTRTASWTTCGATWVAMRGSRSSLP